MGYIQAAKQQYVEFSKLPEPGTIKVKRGRGQEDTKDISHRLTPGQTAPRASKRH